MPTVLFWTYCKTSRFCRALRENGELGTKRNANCNSRPPNKNPMNTRLSRCLCYAPGGITHHSEFQDGVKEVRVHCVFVFIHEPKQRQKTTKKKREKEEDKKEEEEEEEAEEQLHQMKFRWLIDHVLVRGCCAMWTRSWRECWAWSAVWVLNRNLGWKFLACGLGSSFRLLRKCGNVHWSVLRWKNPVTPCNVHENLNASCFSSCSLVSYVIAAINSPSLTSLSFFILFLS